MKKLLLLALVGFIAGCDPDPVTPDNVVDGVCVTGTVKCGNFCVDLKNDMYHCGECYHDCTMDLPNAEGLCNGAGMCKIRNCKYGFADCDGRNPPFDPNTQQEPTGELIQSGQDNGCETRISNPANRCANFDAGK
jgi:hypothetical protein